MKTIPFGKRKFIITYIYEKTEVSVTGKQIISNQWRILNKKVENRIVETIKKLKIGESFCTIQDINIERVK
jgi:hypothetical protein